MSPNTTTSSAILSIYKHSQLTLFDTHVHTTYFPIPWLDLLGALRLSYFVDLIVRDANGIKQGESGRGRRTTFAQEAVGILILIYGGETFLAAMLQTTPSWMISLKTPMLFVGVHYLATRIISISSFIPISLVPISETLLMPFFDCLGRSILLSTFTVDFILSHPNPAINSSPLVMCLAAFIAVVPFASLTFACNMFSREWKFSTPPELQENGWTAVDVWSPPLIAALYGGLAQLHPTFLLPYQFVRELAIAGGPAFSLLKTLPSHPIAMSRENARAVCAIVLSVLYVGRGLYNNGTKLSEMVRYGGRTGHPSVGQSKARASPKASTRKVKQKTQ